MPATSAGMTVRKDGWPPGPEPDLTALALDKAAALRLVPVSRETIERLDAFVALLLQWQAKTNLVAPSTLPQLWTRHIADFLQLFSIAPHIGTWIDLGSGGGFPGIVVACALSSVDGEMHLIERNGKKAAFLREALRVTGAPGVVHPTEIADFVDSFSAPADYITARAVAPLKVLVGLKRPADRARRHGPVSQGPRCRGRVDRSYQILETQTSPAPEPDQPREFHRRDHRGRTAF